jgi:catalase
VITPAQAIDAINERFGRHEGFRSLHAKGLLFKGTFVATAAAARLTKAGHMQGDPVECTVRVSNGSGDPEDPDYAPDVRGMATKLYLPDGSRTDIVAQTAPSFPTKSVDSFIELTRINPTTAGALWRMPWFLVRHPRALPGLPGNLSALRPPESYATCRYYAIHAYKWVAADGAEHWVRYRWEPAEQGKALSGGDAKKRGRDYLQEEIRGRVASGRARFKLKVQIAAREDDPHDPTTNWPDDRETVEAGTLELTEPDTEREQGDDVLVFDPTRVVDGIELSDDPILTYRPRAYSESVERRSGVGPPG